jgi:hypothetical protein
MAQADHPLADLYARPGQDAWRTLGDGFQSTVSRARKTRWLIGLTVAANVLSIVFLVKQRSLLDQGAGNISLTDWNANEARIGAVATVELLLFVTAGILFLRWLHLSYRNLRELGTNGLRVTPGWAVGYWFVPVLNVWRPKQILDDLWKATDEKADEWDGAWRHVPPSPLVGGWWALSVIASLVGFYSLHTSTQTLAELHHRNNVLFAAHFFELATGVMLFKLVGVLTRRQDARAAARGTTV